MTKADDLIHNLKKEFSEISSILESNGEISLSVDYNSIFTKTLIMTISTAFEEKIRILIHSFLNTSQNIMLEEFINIKALKRQYHALFEWEERNANKFFSLFGSEFKKFMVSKVKSNPELDMSIIAFLELGNERNKLAHLNYYLTPIDLTPEEVLEKYNKANSFINSLNESAMEFIKINQKHVA